MGKCLGHSKLGDPISFKAETEYPTIRKMVPGAWAHKFAKVQAFVGNSFPFFNKKRQSEGNCSIELERQVAT